MTITSSLAILYFSNPQILLIGGRNDRWAKQLDLGQHTTAAGIACSSIDVQHIMLSVRRQPTLNGYRDPIACDAHLALEQLLIFGCSCCTLRTTPHDAMVLLGIHVHLRHSCLHAHNKRNHCVSEAQSWPVPHESHALPLRRCHLQHGHSKYASHPRSTADQTPCLWFGGNRQSSTSRLKCYTGTSCDTST